MVAEVTATCECGYDFTTCDPRVAIMRLESEARIGNKQWLRGLVLLITLPIWFLFSSAITGMLAVAQLGLMLYWVVRGVMRADAANAKIAAAKELMALPEARVVQHSQPKARS